MNINLNEIFTKKYEELFKKIIMHTHTHYMLKGGRGCLKSTFIAFSILLLIMTKKNINAVAYRRVGSTLRDSVFAQFNWCISKLGLNYLFKSKTSPMEIIYLPTGSKILFKGLDKAEKQKGITVQRGRIAIVWFEEMDQFEGMDQLRSVIQSCIRSDGENWIFYSFNPPISRNNWANEEALNVRDDRLIFSSNYLEVPKEWLGSQFFIEAEFLKERNFRAYQNEYLGQATGSGGNVFDNIEIRTITDEEINNLCNRHYGLDFGFAIDPAAFAHNDLHNNVLYFIDEIYEQKLMDRDLANKIKAHGITREIIQADSAAPQSIATLCEEGLRVYGASKKPGSIMAGIKYLQSLTKIVIDPERTPNAKDEFISYEYERNREGKFISAVPDKKNHLIDATRYSLVNEIEHRNRGNLSGKRL